MTNTSLTIDCDSSALLLFAKLLDLSLEVSNGSFDLGNLGFELCRVDSYFGSTATGKLLVRLYPSDCLLRFVAARFAGNFDLLGVKQIGHSVSVVKPNVKVNRPVVA